MPGLWTMQGFAAPQYTNVKMPFDDLPPTVPERTRRASTGAGSRSRTSGATAAWCCISAAAEGALHVVLNGEPVGIAKDSRTPAEFDVTELVRHGAENELVAAVVQWSDASFVEDQDQWWHAGLPRSVLLYATPRAYVADVFARGDMDGRWSWTCGPRAGEPRAQLIGPRRDAVLDEPLAGRPARRRVEAPRLWSAERPAPLHARGRRSATTASRARSASGASRSPAGTCSSTASRC